MSQFRLRDVTDSSGVIEPMEGLGAVYPYFTAYRLCDASTAVTPETFDVLRQYPAWDTNDSTPRTNVGGDPDPDWRDKLLKHAHELAEKKKPGFEFAAIDAKLGAIPREHVPEYLANQAPVFFDEFPDGSWWFVRTDQLLSNRLAFLRALLALELTPDLVELNDPVRRKSPGLDAFREHSLTHGAIFDSLLDPLLLSFPLSTIGYAFGWMPHSLVFLFGVPISMKEDWPPSLKALYEPHLHSTFTLEWIDADFYSGIEPVQFEVLLQWWVTRLNSVYSHICDPCRFTDAAGQHDAARQTGWHLTFERMLADMILIRTNLQRAEMVRQEIAFDLLDKAESLLGYGKPQGGRDTSGEGFKHLLRRGEMQPLLNRVWETQLPLQLRSRYRDHGSGLYDDLYRDVRAEAMRHRLTPGGVNVWSEKHQRLECLDNDTYVSRLVREIRNSSHGLLDQISGRNRWLLATHRGKLPPQLPDLAALLGFALIADANAVCAGTWMNGPTPSR
jgi:hypothetical protein